MELEKVLRTVANEIKSFYYQPNLRHVDDYELEEFANHYGVRTQHGSLAFTSNIQLSSLPLTVYVGGKGIAQKNQGFEQSQILKELSSTIEKVRHYAKKVPFACMEKRICDNEDFNLHCTLFTSLYKKESIRLAFLWSQSLFNPQKRRSLKLHLVCIPEWPVRQTLVFPELGVTYVLGNDSFDEIRMGFLRTAMYFAKTNGIQSLYGASKIITCCNDNKEKKFKNYAALFIGPSRVDKTIYLSDNFSLNKKGEEAKLLQNGVLFLRKYNQILGAEKIFSVNVKGLESNLQPLFYRAALSRKTNFENIIVDHQGRLDFQDSTITDSSKAFIRIRDLKTAGSPVLTGEKVTDLEDINVLSIDELDGVKIFIIVKSNAIIPPVCRLTLRQAAMMLMLGESVEGNKIIREPASNPYLVSSPEDEVEGFLDFLENNEQKVEAYLLNTGGVGRTLGKKIGRKRKTKSKKIEPQDILQICKAIFKESIKWEKNRYWQVFVPKSVENVNLNKYKLENFYRAEDIKKAISQLRSERREYLKNFPKLSSYVKKAVV